MTGGRVVMTAAVDALASDVKAMVISAVVTPDSDPSGEHDLGNFELTGPTFFWKPTTTTLPWSSARRIRTIRRKPRAC